MYRKLCCFRKTFHTQSSTVKRAYITRNDDQLPNVKVKYNYFDNLFFPSTAIEWNKLDKNILISEVSLVLREPF